MTVCFLPYNPNKMSRKKTFCFHYIKPIKLICSIKKEKICEVISEVLEHICDMNVFGFNKKTDEYWGKKIIKSESKLHFNLSIIKKDYNSSYIIITPILGTDNEINNLSLKITRFLKLYEK